MIFVTVLDDGRVGAVTTEERFSQGMVRVQEPEEFDIGSFSPRDWVYEDGKLKYDPLPEPEPPEDPVKIANDAKGIAEDAKQAADTAAASVNEYIDAILGLDSIATNETEATDAE